jgi:hypothetical protein
MAKRKGGPNKMELVREALAQGIEDASGIVAFVAKHGGKMSPQMASNYKSSIKKKGKGGRGARRAPKAVATKRATSGAGNGVMATLKAAKSLIDATGSATAAKEVLDLLG